MNIILPDWRYEQIKREVAKVFVNCNIKQIPINGFEIANKLGIILIPYSAFSEEKKKKLIEEDEDGFVVKRGGKFYIYYNDDKSYGRINFTILHEIGHVVLNHTQQSDLAEAEANFFAKYAIAPPVLIEKYCNHMSNLGKLGWIFNNFRVSETSGYNSFSYYLKWKRKFEQINEYTDYELMIIEQFA